MRTKEADWRWLANLWDFSLSKQLFKTNFFSLTQFLSEKNKLLSEKKNAWSPFSLIRPFFLGNFFYRKENELRNVSLSWGHHKCSKLYRKNQKTFFCEFSKEAWFSPHKIVFWIIRKMKFYQEEKTSKRAEKYRVSWCGFEKKIDM